MRQTAQIISRTLISVLTRLYIQSVHASLRYFAHSHNLAHLSPHAMSYLYICTQYFMNQYPRLFMSMVTHRNCSMLLRIALACYIHYHILGQDANKCFIHASKYLKFSTRSIIFHFVYIMWRLLRSAKYNYFSFISIYLKKVRHVLMVHPNNFLNQLNRIFLYLTRTY